MDFWIFMFTGILELQQNAREIYLHF
jgi:hypothetical protein